VVAVQQTQTVLIQYLALLHLMAAEKAALTMLGLDQVAVLVGVVALVILLAVLAVLGTPLLRLQAKVTMVVQVQV
jgi:hypothetical protein